MNITPTLFIGLGNTGGFVCKMAKKLFQRSFGTSASQFPPLIRFIYVNSSAGDDPDEGEIANLPKVDRLCAEIPRDDFREIQEQLSAVPEFKHWLTPNLPLDEIVGGAGEIRQAGRLAFWRFRKQGLEIQPAIQEALEDIIGNQAEKKAKRMKINMASSAPEVYIICSFAGGTGSGMFCDIAGIVKDYNPNAKVTLIVFLPRLFESKVRMKESIHLHHANTYAALKELNYYMDYNPWEVVYDTKRRDSVTVGDPEKEERMFDRVFFIDKENGLKKDLKDRVHVVPAVAEFLYQMTLSLEKSHANIRQNVDKWTEKKTWCSSFGVSLLTFPLEELKDVCRNLCLEKACQLLETGKFNDDDLAKKVSDRNTGLPYTSLNYQKWMEALCPNYEEYETQSARSVTKVGKRGVADKLKAEEKELEENYQLDMRTIEKKFSNVQEGVLDLLDQQIHNEILEHGPRFALTLLEGMRDEFNRQKIDLDQEQKSVLAKSSALTEGIKNDFKVIKKVLKGLDPFFWAKKCEGNIKVFLSNEVDAYNAKFRAQKLSRAIRILEELTRNGGAIDKKKREINNFIEKLGNLKSAFATEGQQARDRLSFASSVEVKLFTTDKETDAFYKKHFSNTPSLMSEELRGKVTMWFGKSLEGIRSDLLKSYQRHFPAEVASLTLTDVCEKDELAQHLDTVFDYAQPFWRHSVSLDGGEQQDSFRISGFESGFLEEYPISKRAKNPIVSDTEKDKRRAIFVRLEYGVLPSAIKNIEKYKEAYDWHIKKKHFWIHLTPEAKNFPELFEKVGMEESEALLNTCRDFGIVFVRNTYYEYEDIVKEEGVRREKNIVIANGYAKTIERIKTDVDLYNLLSGRLMDVLVNKTSDEARKYFRIHDRSNYDSDKKFSQEHEKSYPGIPSHNVPEKVIKEVQKKLSL